jgi:hypothetical protein
MLTLAVSMIVSFHQKEMINLYQSMKMELQKYGIYLITNLSFLDTVEKASEDPAVVLHMMMTRLLQVGETDSSELSIGIAKVLFGRLQMLIEVQLLLSIAMLITFLVVAKMEQSEFGQELTKSCSFNLMVSSKHFFNNFLIRPKEGYRQSFPRS